MEWADLLHVLWAGVARDATGSVLMDAAEYMFNDGPSWNDRLSTLYANCQAWCRQKKIRPSTLEFSLLNALEEEKERLADQEQTDSVSLREFLRIRANFCEFPRISANSRVFLRISTSLHELFQGMFFKCHLQTFRIPRI